MGEIAWSRLVRYIGPDGEIRYGEPVLPQADDGQIDFDLNEDKLQVRVYEGNSALSARPTERFEQVHKLLGPLSFTEVPIIRCIGLNYRTHSMY